MSIRYGGGSITVERPFAFDYNDEEGMDPKTGRYPIKPTGPYYVGAYFYAEGSEVPLTPEMAREQAQALLDAADECERLNREAGL